jgi:hypothetical protein
MVGVVGSSPIAPTKSSTYECLILAEEEISSTNQHNQPKSRPHQHRIQHRISKLIARHERFKQIQSRTIRRQNANLKAATIPTAITPKKSVSGFKIAVYKILFSLVYVQE